MNNQIVKNEQIRPVVYGIGLYFLFSGLDCISIGAAGSVIKLISFIPLFLVLLDLRKLRIRFSPIVVFQLLFWFLTVVSLFYSISATKTFSSIKTLSLNLVLILALGMLEQYNQRELQYMQKALFLGGWTVILLILLFPDFSRNGRLTLGLGGVAQDQNFINGYFVYTFSWHCNKTFQEKKKIHIIPLGGILSIVLLTGSRGALLAFIFVLFTHICVFFARTKHAIRNVVLIVLLLLLLLVTFDITLSIIPEEIAKRFSWEFITESGTSGRTRIWKFLFNHFVEDDIPRMLFGYGYGTILLVNTMNEKVAHNLYLDNLITIGLVGLILQLALHGAVLRILLKHRQYLLLGAFVGMVGLCMSLSLVAYKPIWNIILLTLAVDFYEKSKSDTETLSGRLTGCNV